MFLSHQTQELSKNPIWSRLLAFELYTDWGCKDWLRCGWWHHRLRQVLYRKQIRLLERFHVRCLRSILGIKWQDYVSNEEVFKRASLTSIESILLQVQLRWAGHVTKMEDVRMPGAVFFCELQEGKRDHGVPSTRHKEQLKRQFAQAGINHQPWQQEASDRDSWRWSVKKASHKFEAEKHEAAKERRRTQKERVASQLSSAHIVVCPKCSRVCASRIGLYTCKNWPSAFPKIKSSSARNQPSSWAVHVQLGVLWSRIFGNISQIFMTLSQSQYCTLRFHFIIEQNQGNTLLCTCVKRKPSVTTVTKSIMHTKFLAVSEDGHLFFLFFYIYFFSQ